MNYMKQYNVAISRFTTLKIGGIVEEVFSPLNEEGIVQAFSEIKTENKKFFILGGGSNVVIKDDQKLYYAVVMSTRLTHYRFHDNIFEVQCGLSANNVAELAATHELSGLEFCYGLPGTIGGAVFMNARAYGSELADIVDEVHAYDYDEGRFVVLKNNDFNFSYKYSIFQEKPFFIYKVKLRLMKSKGSLIRRKMEDAKHKRSESGHYLEPSAGCTFKNNENFGAPTGKIIDELGLKGLESGGVKISQSHGNFIVNNGNGTFEDYLKLVNEIKKKVKDVKNIDLDCEVRFLP